MWPGTGVSSRPLRRPLQAAETRENRSILRPLISVTVCASMLQRDRGRHVGNNQFLLLLHSMGDFIFSRYCTDIV